MPSMESFAARQPRQMMLLLGPSALISMEATETSMNQLSFLNSCLMTLIVIFVIIRLFKIFEDKNLVSLICPSTLTDLCRDEQPDLFVNIYHGLCMQDANRLEIL